jgi:MoaA/NifB/PqqE/SkfB family radical SAM enzyme
MRLEDPDLRLRGVIEGRLLAGPETLQLNLQDPCNLRCIFCWSHSALRPPLPPRQTTRLSDAHLRAIVDALPRLRPGRVVLSGRGEPLLHPGARALLAALQRAAVPVAIQTNGTTGLTPDELIELDVARLTVNASAATVEGYERVHPGQGALREELVRRLRRLAELRRGSTPEVVLVAVITAASIDEMTPLVELAAEIGARRVVLKGIELAAGLEALLLRDAPRDRARAELELARRRGAQVGVEIVATHLEQVLRGSERGDFTPRLERGPCYMGWFHLRVTSDGQVMFCCKDKRVGHLDERGLYEIWRSPTYHLRRLGGRDGDGSVGLFDDKCRACSNFERNGEVGREVAALVGPPYTQERRP